MIGTNGREAQPGDVWIRTVGWSKPVPLEKPPESKVIPIGKNSKKVELSPIEGEMKKIVDKLNEMTEKKEVSHDAVWRTTFHIVSTEIAMMNREQGKNILKALKTNVKLIRAATNNKG